MRRRGAATAPARGACAPPATAAARALALALAACTPPAAAPTAPERERAPVWQVRPSGGARPIDPGPARAELLDPQGCASCHAAIVAEWAASRHARAWTNSIFRREYDARPQAWCVNCHAPLTTQQAALAVGDHARADQGVDCAACHVRRGAIVSARKRPGSPHATVEEPTFGTPAFCADCHQFSFPVLHERTGAAVAFTAHPMQTTVASFRAGPYAGERAGCLACHGSRHGHAFPGAHDPDMLASALEVRWCRDGELLQLAIDNVAAGHTVPTGDIHRHMNLRVWRSSAPEAMFEAFLGRRFEPAPDGGKATTWDSTLPPGGTRRFAVPIARLGGDDDEPLNLELIYVFIADEFPRSRRAPDEPARTSVVRRRMPLAELPACARSHAVRRSVGGSEGS